MERASGERTLSSGIVLPAPDMRDAHVGMVFAAGRGKLPLEVNPGDRVLYSSRADTFILDDGKTIDIVEENSVIGVIQ